MRILYDSCLERLISVKYKNSKVQNFEFKDEKLH